MAKHGTLKYTQCELQYGSGAIGVAWIPSDKAIEKAHIRIGDSKNTMVPAVVVAVYGSTDKDMAKYQNDWAKAKRRTDI